MQHAPAAPPPPLAGVIVSGPNHALHAILSLLTFWACGGWIWVWLIVALDNKKRVQAIDAYGNPIVTPQQVAARQEQRRQQLIALAVIAVIVVVIVILSALIS